jgi:hypothetical protein
MTRQTNPGFDAAESDLITAEMETALESVLEMIEQLFERYSKIGKTKPVKLGHYPGLEFCPARAMSARDPDMIPRAARRGMGERTMASDEAAAAAKPSDASAAAGPRPSGPSAAIIKSAPRSDAHHKPSRNIILRLLGPGLVTGAADDDPSGIATFPRHRRWRAGFGLAMKEVLRIDRANPPRPPRGSGQPIFPRSLWSY